MSLRLKTPLAATIRCGLSRKAQTKTAVLCVPDPSYGTGILVATSETALRVHLDHSPGTVQHPASIHIHFSSRRDTNHGVLLQAD